MTVVAPSAAASPGAPSGADRRLPGLDGLRGLAVAWVLAFHLWPDVVRGGWLGVGLFFTLSGYLIAGLLDAEVTSTGGLRLGRFMARRVRRLLPAALVTIAGTLALTVLVDDQPLRIIGVDALTAVLNVFNWHASLDEVGYAGIFEATPEPLAHFWSLAIEEQFYLVFPAAVALTRRPGRVVGAMAAIGLAGVWLWWGSTDAYVATPVRALEIAAGAGLAVARNRVGALRGLFQPRAGLPRAPRIAWGLLLAVAVALTAVSVARLGPDDAFVFRGGPQLMALCWVVLVVAAARDGWPARLMSWAPLRWLGLRSYAIYLFHWPVVELTDWHPVAVIAVTLGAAELSFRLLEMPVRRGTGRWAIPVLAVTAVLVLAVSAVAAAASSPVPGIAEWAEGTDELPRWYVEQSASGSAVPATNAARSPAEEPEPPDGASTTPPTAPSTGAAAPEEPMREREDLAPEDLAPGTTSPAAEPPPESSEVADQAAPETAMPVTAVPVPAVPVTAAPVTAAPVPAVPVTAAPETDPLQPDAGAATPIVTVLGDSVALYMSGGLRYWADTNQTMAVLNRTRIACSPVGFPDSGWKRTRDYVGAEPTQIGWEDGPCRDDDIEPGSTLVLVIDHGAVLFDHERSDGSWASILDEDLASDVADSYRRLVTKARGVGARVAFATAPRPLPLPGDSEPRLPQAEPERARAYNALLRDLASEFNAGGGFPAVEVIDTATGLDAAGYDGPYGRSDGTHLGFERAVFYAADVLGPALLRLLGMG